MSIKDWPPSERPREKLLQAGPATLSDAELLAIFLRTGIAGALAVELARRLLGDFKGLRPLLNADLQTFSSGPGLGPAKYCQLQAVLEMSRRQLGESLQRGNVFSSPALTRRYLREQSREVFARLFLDSQHRLIVYEPLFYGTIDSASVYPREVVKRALQLNAAALILAHNHPSGVAEPSQADRRITGRIGEALALVDIRLLDHFVVGDGEVVSLVERHG